MKNECRKRRFDRLGAMLVLAKSPKCNNWNRQETRTYFCSMCNYWHLTSQDKKGNKNVQ